MSVLWGNDCACACSVVRVLLCLMRNISIIWKPFSYFLWRHPKSKMQNQQLVTELCDVMNKLCNRTSTALHRLDTTFMTSLTTLVLYMQYWHVYINNILTCLHFQYVNKPIGRQSAAVRELPSSWEHPRVSVHYLLYYFNWSVHLT